MLDLGALLLLIGCIVAMFGVIWGFERL